MMVRAMLHVAPALKPAAFRPLELPDGKGERAMVLPFHLSVYGTRKSQSMMSRSFSRISWPKPVNCSYFTTKQP